MKTKLKKLVVKWLWLSISCAFAYIYGLLFGYVWGSSKTEK